MSGDMMLRVPARLRAPLTEIAKQEYRRSATDAARALLEAAIVDRVITKGATRDRDR